MIQKHIENEKQLTIHNCSGTILKEELIDAVKALYTSGPTRNYLWDITGADLSQIKADDLQEIVETATQYASIRKGGRTAIVSASSVGFGLGRMYKAFAENVGLQIEINVFRSPEEAKEWISASPGEYVANQWYQIA